jgi:hypothetical protein
MEEIHRPVPSLFRRRNGLLFGVLGAADDGNDKQGEERQSDQLSRVKLKGMVLNVQMRMR